MSTATQQKRQKNQDVQNYYVSVFGRNIINAKIVPAILFWICLPKQILEVFTKKHMGERYFSRGLAVFHGIVLFLLPRLAIKMHPNPGLFSYYLFFIGYVIMTVVCFIDLRRAPSVFDFARFSLCPGISHSFFKRIKIFGKTPSQRTIDVYLEPLFCFGIGFVLLVLSQYLTSILIMFCALCYFISNYSFALRGDHFIMDQIDLIICNQDLTETFMQDKDMSPRGVPFYGKKPSTRELRESLAASIVDDYEDIAVAK